MNHAQQSRPERNGRSASDVSSCTAPASGSCKRFDDQQIREWADLVASGEAAMPLDLEPAQAEALEAMVRCRRRDRLVRYIGRCVALDLRWRFVADYRDDAISGRYIEKRDEFQRMLRDIRGGTIQVDAILVDTAERLGRAEEIPAIRQRLWRQNGVLVLAANTQFADPTSEAGQALSFVEQIRSTSINTVKAHEVLRGKKDRALRGLWPGACAPLGYRLVKNIVTTNGREQVESQPGA